MANPNPCQGLNSLCSFTIQNSPLGNHQTNSRSSDLEGMIAKNNDDSIAMKTNQETGETMLAIKNTGDVNGKGKKILAPNFSPRVITDSHVAHMSNSEFADGILPYKGSIIVNPGKNFFDSAHSIWKNSCIGLISDKIPFSIDKFKDNVLKDLKCLGVINVFRHNLGFLILKFDTNENLITATELGTFRVDSVNDPFEILLKPWDEKLFMSLTSHETVKMWIQMSAVPFTYWSKEGLFRLASAIGKPVKFDKMTTEAVHNCSPAYYATILVEISVMSALPNVIIAYLDENASAVARVPVLYLSTLELCEACHKISHDTADCPHLVDILNTEKFYANREKFGWYLKLSSQTEEKKNDATNVNLIAIKSDETGAILGNPRSRGKKRSTENVNRPFSLSNSTKGKKRKFRNINDILYKGGTGADAGVGVGAAMAASSDGVGRNVGLVDEADVGSLLMSRMRGRPRGKPQGSGHGRSRGRGGGCLSPSLGALPVPKM